MNYNQFCYYRANPYHQIGNMPPIAHMNRRQQQYSSEIPQGEHHHQINIGRKHFQSIQSNNSIKQQGILKNPQYQYNTEAIKALDRSYERNLKNVDIEGTSASSLVSQGVRNKLKARQYLQRKINQGKTNDFYNQQMIFNDNQEKIKQQIAKTYQNNQHLRQLIQEKKKYNKNQQIFDNSKHNNTPSNLYQQEQLNHYERNIIRNNHQSTGLQNDLSNNLKTIDSNQKDKEYYQNKQVRRYNPTYLSYGNQSIKMAGKNIVGY